MLQQKSTNASRTRVFGLCVGLFIACSVQLTTEALAAETENPNDILVIANHGVTVNSVSETFVRDLFLKVRKEWKTGVAAVPIVPKDEKLRNEFRKKILNMDAMAEQRYWEDSKVKYGLAAPMSLANTLRAVFSLKGSISYVYRKDYSAAAAKILMVIPAK